MVTFWRTQYDVRVAFPLLFARVLHDFECTVSLFFQVLLFLPCRPTASPVTPISNGYKQDPAEIFLAKRQGAVVFSIPPFSFTVLPCFVLVLRVCIAYDVALFCSRWRVIDEVNQENWKIDDAWTKFRFLRTEWRQLQFRWTWGSVGVTGSAMSCATQEKESGELPQR